MRAGMTIILLLLALLVEPVFAQSPAVQITNLSRPESKTFQVGDLFRIVVSGAPKQPVYVRTARMESVDWSSVVGWTDGSGQWSISGHFEKSDFGPWGEFWTVGNKLAPVLDFWVSAPPCSGLSMAEQIGLVSIQTCEGSETYQTPSSAASFRTPDGRVIAGTTGMNEPPDQYHAHILLSLIASGQVDRKSGVYADDVAALVTKTIGGNALSDAEIASVLGIVNKAYSSSAGSGPSGDHSRTVLFLQSLAASTDQASLKQKVAETIQYIESR